MVDVTMKLYGVWKQVGPQSWLLIDRGITLDSANALSDMLKRDGHTTDVISINKLDCPCPCHARGMS
jgi:hypothetical protein